MFIAIILFSSVTLFLVDEVFPGKSLVNYMLNFVKIRGTCYYLENLKIEWHYFHNMIRKTWREVPSKIRKFTKYVRDTLIVIKSVVNVLESVLESDN